MFRWLSVVAVVLLAGCSSMVSHKQAESVTLEEIQFLPSKCRSRQPLDPSIEGVIKKQQLCYFDISNKTHLVISITDYDHNYWKQKIYSSNILWVRDRSSVKNISDYCANNGGHGKIIGGSMVQCIAPEGNTLTAYNSVITPEGRNIMAVISTPFDTPTDITLSSPEFDKITRIINHNNLKKLLNYPDKTIYEGNSSSFSM